MVVCWALELKKLAVGPFVTTKLVSENIINNKLMASSSITNATVTLVALQFRSPKYAEIAQHCQDQKVLNPILC